MNLQRSLASGADEEAALVHFLLGDGLWLSRSQKTFEADHVSLLLLVELFMTSCSAARL